MGQVYDGLAGAVNGAGAGVFEAVESGRGDSEGFVGLVDRRICAEGRGNEAEGAGSNC
jgi:hypothetical protein